MADKTEISIAITGFPTDPSISLTIFSSGRMNPAIVEDVISMTGKSAEIKLVQKQMETERKKVEAGVIPSESVFATERELLKLKRQMAALDAGQPISITAAEVPAAATNTEGDEVRRIQALVKDSPDLINAPQAAGETLLQNAAANGKLAVVKLLL